MAHPHKAQALASRHAKVRSMHADAPQDHALVSAAIKRHETKHHAHIADGHKYPTGLTGGDNGVGRLEKASSYGVKDRPPGHGE